MFAQFHVLVRKSLCGVRVMLFSRSKKMGFVCTVELICGVSILYFYDEVGLLVFEPVVHWNTQTEVLEQTKRGSERLLVLLGTYRHAD